MLNKNMPALTIRGKIYLCPVAPARPCGLYVFQRVAQGKGNIDTDRRKATQLRRHVIPHDPRTPAQLAQRSRFRAAVAAWQALDAATKIYWRGRGKSRRIPGYGAFLSAHIRGQN